MARCKNGWFMKAFFKKVFGKLRWFLLLFGVTIVFEFISFLILPYSLDDDDILPKIYVEPDEIMDVSVDSDGNMAVYNVTDANYMLTYLNLKTGEQFLFKTEFDIVGEHEYSNELRDVIAGDDGRIYAVISSYGSRDEFIQKETVISFSPDDPQAHDVIFTISYDNEFVRARRLTDLSFSDGILRFSYVDYEKTVLYQYDPASHDLDTSHDYLPDENGNFIFQAAAAGDKYVLVRSDGYTFVTGFDEPLGESVMKIHESLDDFDRERLIRGNTAIGDDIYTYNAGSSVYRLEDGQLTEIVNMNDYIDEDLSQIVSLVSDGEDLIIGVTGGVFRYSNGNVEPIEIRQKTEIGYILGNIADTIGTLALILAVIGVIMHLIVRPKTILYKQLVSVIPTIAVLVIVIAYNLYGITIDQQNLMNESKLKAVCTLCMKELEGNDFSGLTSMDANTGKTCTELREKLVDLEMDEEYDVGFGYSLTLFSQEKGGKYVPLVSSRIFTVPLTTHYTEYYFDDSVEMPSDGEVTITLKSASILSRERLSELYAVGKLKDTGDSDIYLIAVPQNYNITYSRLDMWFQTAFSVIAIFAVVTLILTVNAIYVTRGITKASKAIKKIASGDLSARADYKAKDELGEICGQVNNMASSLQDMFDEKDKTEKFYYKFVPEKFRVFLGKENFTDLKLGDAKSRELTILFCDIRSFSINSEIMTAKENFEFINGVYGKAGPIVRENNGFIDKYIGDAIMALFDNADDAVRCGIELYKRVVLAEDSNIKIGVGIHSGMAMVGIVGESERLSGTVIADAVNLSSRLESLTKQYKTAMLVSKDTIDRLSDADIYNLRYLGIMQVAGVNEVKSVYEVLDCLPDDVREERQSHSMELREAIKNFHMGNRKEAVEILTKIEENCDDEKDTVIKMYLDYIKNMSDEDKGNVFRFTRK